MDEKYVIVTDSGCDLPYSYLNEHGIECVDLTFSFEQTGEVYRNRDFSNKEFYARMRDGMLSRTAACNPEEFAAVFEQILKQGIDIFYIGFDSGISTTVNSGMIAARELSDQYQDRQIRVLDTLSACGGEGLLVWIAQQNLEAGMSLEDNVSLITRLAPQVAHRFTVETLTYLCRGGRVSKTAAFAGNVLDLKPVLHTDDEGRLINLSKVRGRSKSIAALAEAFGSTALAMRSDDELSPELKELKASLNGQTGPIIICHADCYEDAAKLAELVKDKYGCKVDMISEIGPVIGSHSGPGTLALFFLATKR